MDYFLEEKDKDGNFDYRARSSVAWDYEGCMYYLKPFREKFAEDRWNTYWILKYQNWNTAESEADPPMSCINEGRYGMQMCFFCLLSLIYVESRICRWQSGI